MRLHCIVILTGIVASAISLNAQRVIELAPYQVHTQAEADYQSWLPASQLKSAKPIDVAEVLSTQVPEISLIRRAGSNNDLALRGLAQDNINLLVDGRRVYCACSNRMDPPASHASSSQVKRIELTTGAFDVTRSGSLGGTLNVITREPSAEEAFELIATTGSYGLYQAEGWVTGGSEHLSALASASFQQADPYKDGSGKRLTDMPDDSPSARDDYRPEARDNHVLNTTRFNTKLKWTPNEQRTVTASFAWEEGTDIYYPGLLMDSDLNRTTMLGLNWKQTTHADWCDELEIDLYGNLVEHEMRDTHRQSSVINAAGIPWTAANPAIAARGWSMETVAESSVLGIWTQATAYRENNTILDYGAEAYRRNWNNDNVVLTLSNNMIPDVDMDVAGAFVRVERSVSDWEFTAGVRFDHAAYEVNDATPTLSAKYGNPDLGQDETEWSGNAMARYSFSEDTSAYVGAGRSVRFPNAQERYFNLQRPGTMRNWLGNPGLSPTINHELSAGADTQLGGLNLRGKIFHSWLNNYIYYNTLNATGAGALKTARSYTNIDATLYGFDFAADYPLNEHFTLEGGIAYQRGKKEQQPNGSTDRDLGEIPPLKGRAALLFDYEKWNASAEVLAAKRQTAIDSDIGEQEIAGYGVLNLTLGRDMFEGTSLTVGIDNALDKTYATHNAYTRNPFGSGVIVNEAGRFFYATVKVGF